MNRPPYLKRTVAVFVFSILSPPRLFAADCTDGVDCYCDCLQSPGAHGTFANSACQQKGFPRLSHVVWCEDAEDPSLHDDLTTRSWCSNKANNSFGFSRGSGSAWALRYGQASQDCGWDLGTPQNPLRCSAHDNSYGGAFSGDWHPNDLWQINSKACVNVHKSGDTTEPQIDTPSVHDGKSILGLRVPAGALGSSAGTARWSAKTTIAVTRAFRFSSNYLRQKTAQIKFDEWTVNGDPKHHWDMMGSSDNQDLFPFGNLLLNHGASNDFTCEQAADGANWNGLGTKSGSDWCNSWIRAIPTQYSQKRDWPDLTQWTCVRGVLKSLNSPNTEWKLWIGEKMILNTTNLNTSNWNIQIDGIMFNPYMNQNQAGYPTSGKSTESVTRWMDNWTVRGWTDQECQSDPNCGVPARCDQIGFTGNPQPGKLHPPARPKYPGG